MSGIDSDHGVGGDDFSELSEIASVGVTATPSVVACAAALIAVAPSYQPSFCLVFEDSLLLMPPLR